MIYYANPTGELVQDAIAAGRLGCITTPEQGNVTFPHEWDVIADNGCFSDRWEHHAWLRWLLDRERTIRFAVAPDVFDPTGRPTHAETLERWRTYGPLIERHGFVPAFVCQVGSTPQNVPDAPVLFLGGTTEWKEGRPAELLAEWANERGVWVHMGRVNTLRRLRIAKAFGCHSVDGTTISKGSRRNLPQMLRFLREIETQGRLDGIGSGVR